MKTPFGEISDDRTSVCACVCAALLSRTHEAVAKHTSITTRPRFTAASSPGRNLNKALASCSKSGRLDCCGDGCQRSDGGGGGRGRGR